MSKHEPIDVPDMVREGSDGYLEAVEELQRERDDLLAFANAMDHWHHLIPAELESLRLAAIAKANGQ